MSGALNPNWTYGAMVQGMAQAARGANPTWWTYMFVLIVEIARRQETLYTDDIEALRYARNGPTTHEQRAIGPLMKAAEKAGIITKTQGLIPGRWDKKIWFSLLYQRGMPSPWPGITMRKLP